MPIFKQQIARGGPLTVTHPDAQRYFMSIGEAASLILQAGAVGSDSEIFVLDMGDPVRIVTLAETMITLSGLEPYRDVDIVFTGLRPGEKLAEEVSFQSESLRGTAHEKLLVLDTHRSEGTAAAVQAFLDALPGLTNEQVKSKLRELVPEYTPAEPARVGD